MKIENEGRIRSIELPESWQERQIQKQPLALKQMRSFHSGDNANVQIRFIYRGHAESAETGVTFQTCLASPPRALDRSEINSLALVLGDLAEPEDFNIVSALTMDLSGQRVLWVEGRWQDSPYWSGTVFVDADGTGRAVQEIECFAELSAYEAASPTFQQILRSIVWK